MSLRTRLGRFINHKYTDITIAVLILLSILFLILETIWERSGNKPNYHFCILANDIITVIFIAELYTRFFTYRKKTRFLKHYWLDILAVLPVLRPFRIIRFLRLLRIFRMGLLLNRRIFSVSAVLREGVKEYLIIFFIIIMVVLTSGMAIGVLEGHANPAFETLPKNLWWSVMSMISGEPINAMPNTFWGKMITLILMLGGLTLFAVFTGVVSAVMVQKLRGGLSVKELDLEELKNHIIICGWHRSAALIIEELQTDKEYRLSPIVLVAEFSSEPYLNYDFVDRNRIYIIKDDYTKIEVLKKAGVEKAKIAFILPDKTIERSDQDRDARSVLAALIIEKLNKNIFTCVELLNCDNETHLQMAGVEEVIVSDEYSGNIMAATARNNGIISVLNELLTSKYGNQFYKLKISSSWVGKTAIELFVWLKKEYNAILLSVENKDSIDSNKARVNPDINYTFKKGDRIIVISHEKISLK
jgi:voltage-gated potassium channel